MLTTLPEPGRPAPAGTRVQIEVVRSLPALERYETAWNRLAFNSPQRWAGLAYAWIVSHLETVLEPGESWCCVLATEDEELVGVLPVVREPYSVLGLKRPRLATPHKWDSYSVDFLVADGRHGEIVPLLMQALRREEPKLFYLLLSKLPELSPALSLAKSPLDGFSAYQGFCSHGAYLPITQSFQAYQAGLKPAQRKSLTRARKRLNDLCAVRTVFLQGEQAARWDTNEFLNLESVGWKGKQGSAIRSKPPVARFYQNLTRRLGQLGWLQWTLLVGEDRLLAGQLAVRMNGTLACVKTAYDERLAHCAPGKVLFADVLQRAFADGSLVEVDCVSDAAWLADWGMQTRPYYNLWFYPHRLLSLTRGLLTKRTWARLGQLAGGHQIPLRANSL